MKTSFFLWSTIKCNNVSVFFPYVLACLPTTRICFNLSSILYKHDIQSYVVLAFPLALEGNLIVRVSLFTQVYRRPEISSHKLVVGNKQILVHRKLNTQALRGKSFRQSFPKIDEFSGVMWPSTYLCTKAQLNN
jgi:hypothetical protein